MKQFLQGVQTFNEVKEQLLAYKGKKVRVWYYEEKENATITKVDLVRGELMVWLDCQRYNDDWKTPCNQNRPYYQIPFTHLDNYGLEFLS